MPLPCLDSWKFRPQQTTYSYLPANPAALGLARRDCPVVFTDLSCLVFKPGYIVPVLIHAPRTKKSLKSRDPEAFFYDNLEPAYLGAMPLEAQVRIELFRRNLY